MTDKTSGKTTEHLKTIALVVDASRENRMFEKYGHVVSPIMAKSLEDNTMVDAGNNVWTQNGEYRKILNGGTVFYPHEPVQDHITNIIKERKVKGIVQGTTKDNPIDTYDRRFGFIKYWKFMTDKSYTMKNR